MWSNDLEMAKAIADQMVRLLRPQQHDNDALQLLEPSPAKPRPIPKGKPGSQEWFLSLPPPETPFEAEARGAAIIMRRPKIKPKPPRAPDQQQERSNWLWSWWS